MARDAIGLKGIDFEDDGKTIPEASGYEAAIVKAKEDTEDFDYTCGILTMVDVDFVEYRKRNDNKMVRRNVTSVSYTHLDVYKRQYYNQQTSGQRAEPSDLYGACLLYTSQGNHYADRKDSFRFWKIKGNLFYHAKGGSKSIKMLTGMTGKYS